MIHNFEVSKEDGASIEAILKRAKKAFHDKEVDWLGMHMDITVCHTTACPLDLEAFSKSVDQDFFHDLSGISRHLNRDTGKLGNCFQPRFAK